MFSSASNSWRSRRNSRREPSGRFSATSRPGSPSGDSNPPTFRRQSSSSPKVAPNPFSGEAGSSTRSPDAAKPPTTATTPPRAREEAAAEALRSLMAEQQLSQTDLLRGLALL